MVIAAAMQALVLDDGGQGEAFAQPDVAAPRHQIEFRAGKRYRAEPRVLAAPLEHRWRRHVVLDDPQLRPALDAFVVHRRASCEQRGQQYKDSSHGPESWGARVTPWATVVRSFGSSGR